MLRVSRDVSDIADERTGGTGARFWRRTDDGPDSFEPSRPPSFYRLTGLDFVQEMEEN